MWAPGRTKAIAITQFAMLASALDIIKVGGTIVYSTCALSKLENDGIIEKLYQKRAGRFELIHKSFSFGEPTEFGWQVLPDTIGWGPFYLAVVKRVR
jgi:16S rRNA C967 or C1407 C5-methylase (RsmB/RsmF family)